MTVLMDRAVLKHLKCMVDDYLLILQSINNPYYFILVKADNGYKITRYHMKKTYQINVRFTFPYLSSFDFTNCTYYLRKNNSIRIILKVNDDN